MATVNKKFAVEKGLEVGDDALVVDADNNKTGIGKTCLLYTSPSPRDVEECRMPSSA